MSEYLNVKVLAAELDRHLTERDEDAGCALRCGYDGDDRAEHLAQALLPVVGTILAETIAELVKQLEPTWPRGMYGCPDDMFSRRDLRAALAVGAA